jgi:drug/metabolite transporter (DMT)-like permease
MSKPNFHLRAAFELTFASVLWGFGFIAAVWALDVMGPLSLTGWRFFIAAFVGLGISLLVPSLRRQATPQQFMLAAIPGLLLCLTILLQTWGLLYTTATKSGFITTIYVLIVPLLEFIFLKRPLAKKHFIYVALGLIGVALICDLPAEINGSQAAAMAAAAPQLALKLRWNFGDLLTLGCAIVASFHIVYFGKIQKRIGSAFVFNNFQSIWACVLPLSLAMFFEGPILIGAHGLHFMSPSLIGFCSLAFGSTLIAFALQVRAQKILSPSLASLLFLLESPFATLFAVYFLGEKLKTSQWVGAGLILLAAGLSTALATED